MRDNTSNHKTCSSRELILSGIKGQEEGDMINSETGHNGPLNFPVVT
jgi:hypothetical protein